MPKRHATYGVYRPNRPDGDLTFFITERGFAPGAYQRLGPPAVAGRVYIAESVPALIMGVQAEIEAVEAEGQARLRFGFIDDAEAARLADKLTAGLIRRLSEDDGIWEQDPDWLVGLEPIAGTQG